MNYDHIFEDAPHIAPPAVEGTWQVIRFQPDFVTGERFNIGVVFFEKRKSTPHARLLPTLIGFKALYGADGADNFKFLLSLLHEQLIVGRQAVSPSPQIVFGEKKFAAGNNPQEIVDHLFKTMVTLAAAKDTEDDETANPASLHTVKLRERVATLARRKMGKDWTSIFRREPVAVADDNGNRHSLDLPIWYGEDMFSAQIYGTILSAQFRSAAHRAASLSTGYVNFSQAAEIATKGKGGLLILRPSPSNPAYDDHLQNDIDNDIDKITWPYLKKKNITIHIADTAQELAEAALALL
jgi:hypothetical protein